MVTLSFTKEARIYIEEKQLFHYMVLGKLTATYFKKWSYNTPQTTQKSQQDPLGLTS